MLVRTYLTMITTYTYSVTTAAMWTGKLSTKIVYKGQYNAFINFMIQLFQFAEANKNNKGSKSSDQRHQC